MPDDVSNAYMPDVSYVGGLERPMVKQGAAPYMPDLAVEVKSPDDTYIRMREKAAYYLAHGARMVWPVYPEKQIVEVYQPEVDIQILTAGDTIAGGDVLPGFTLAVSDIFVG